jgi:hypothetical protein
MGTGPDFILPLFCEAPDEPCHLAIICSDPVNLAINEDAKG